ncbi:MAG: hypothetical protein BWY72_00663 [Bacteroidetes bacterium ADurb.Bin416]|jgi:hypothetical protein|nr:MAG: hypothetical protein BWY72_00663 [Bacteroidetes bacterium ADurb.Bin416]
MKGIQFFTLFFLFISMAVAAQRDSVYVIYKGSVVYNESLQEIDSISFVNTVNIPVAAFMAKDERFTLFNEALQVTGWADRINQTPLEDSTFNPAADTRPLMTHTVLEERPKARKTGFTILAVSDSTLARFKECPACPDGVRNLQDLEKVARYFYSRTFNKDADALTDYTDKKHYLNRFIAYHCFDRIMAASRFIKDYDTPHQLPQYDMFEYLEPLLEQSLVEVQLDRDCSLPNSRLGLLNSMGDTSKAVLFTAYVDKPAGGIAKNGYYHEISAPLLFTEALVADLSSKRLRMDIASFFPELVTNNMRGNNPTAVAGVQGKTHAYLLPNNYIEGISLSGSTRMAYLGACAAYEDYQGDEFYFRGPYDITLKTPHIPPGTYELRMGYQPTVYRGLVLFYVDGMQVGDTVNLSLLADNPSIGWELPGSNPTDLDGLKNDSLLHTRGYMKGPASFYCFGHWYGYNADNARLSRQNLRKIIGTFTFTEFKPHTLRIQCVLSRSSDTQLAMDYLEFVPVQLLETEGID